MDSTPRRPVPSAVPLQAQEGARHAARVAATPLGGSRGCTKVPLAAGTSYESCHIYR
ncbi:hypothetical protein FAIPA1_60183 [Frankia sp. AiPs1]